MTPRRRAKAQRPTAKRYRRPASTAGRNVRAQKRERLVARVSLEDKQIITRAAVMAGQSVGSFMLSEARKAALASLEARHRIILNAEQSRRFVEALLAPPRPPTERMKRALKLYRETVISDVNV
ncbi:MAG: type II toxin-antitoxin system TacA family antitoxin [Limisphaerales bacterium]